jgi:hypothetical protein
MGIIRFFKSRYRTMQRKASHRNLLSRSGTAAGEISRAEWNDSLKNPTGFYEHCFHYFHTRLSKELREHRAYFEKNGRGFGEEAFHTMWFLLFREFRPESFLEIGVFRGQTLSLAALLARQFQMNCFVQGISPFSSAGDAVSRYQRGVDYYDDTLKNFAHFNLSPPSLLKAFSTDESARKLISSRVWSCIYIDGNHDYGTVRQDWELCAASISRGGIIVLDDSGLGTDYSPPVFATAGHPGPSQLAKEIDRHSFREILQVGHNRVFEKLT